MFQRRAACLGAALLLTALLTAFLTAASLPAVAQEVRLGEEVAVPRHLEDGEEFTADLKDLVAHGALLFDAVWTEQEGGGRPLTTGTGKPLANPDAPLVFPRNFNRISAPDANSCFGCHNAPRSGGGGDIVANVFVLGQRFDHVTFDPEDLLPLSGSHDELGELFTLDQVANSRNTLGMFGAGYIEMLARQVTADLQAIVAATAPGEERDLTSKGLSFGTISRLPDGTWDTSDVAGLPPGSIASTGPDNPPSMVLKPFHQAGAVVSLREFSNNAFNHHHGIQSTERFGLDTDPDGDGFTNEMTRADVTAVSVYQAVLAVPGRRIPRVQEIEEAVLVGEAAFAAIGCTSCHVPALPLDEEGWVFTEPNPYNPAGNLRPGEAPTFAVDLNSKELPLPRLRARNGVTMVPAYTDLKLHDVTSGPEDPNHETLDMQQPAGSMAFFAGNSRFLTRKLWGVANEPPYFHHGKYTTLRTAILAHAGEAQASTDAFNALTDYQRDAVIEFLKTLVVLPPGTDALTVDENDQPRPWPPAWVDKSGP